MKYWRGWLLGSVVALILAVTMHSNFPFLINFVRSFALGICGALIEFIIRSEEDDDS